jgi:antirestriction protein ArdC
MHEPGKIATAYSAFWNYSLGNQWLAMAQLGRAEPINTFPGWKALERHVKKGERAIELLMPVFKKAAKEVTGKEEKDEGAVFFIARKNWFGLHQTDGKDYVPVTPGFDITRAIIGLGITQEPFECSNGNRMGYAKPDENIIAVSPIAYDKLKTITHEIGHVKLHKGMVSMHAPDAIPRDVREVEAELVAYLTAAALGKTENLAYSRGYIQSWNVANAVEKVRFGKVFATADAILKAGRIEPERPDGLPDPNPPENGLAL